MGEAARRKLVFENGLTFDDTDTTDEGRLNRAGKAMYDDLVKYCIGKPVTLQAVDGCQDIVDRHRARARARGIDFPDMVVMVLPRLGAIEVVRRDLDEKGLGMVLYNITVKHPTVTAKDLAEALARSFPEYASRIADMHLPKPKAQTDVH